MSFARIIEQISSLPNSTVNNEIPEKSVPNLPSTTPVKTNKGHTPHSKVSESTEEPNEEAEWREGDLAFKLAKGSPPWPVKVIGLVDNK